MIDDLLSLRKNCVDFALRLHPNQTAYHAAGVYPAQPYQQPTIISPKIEVVLDTAAKLFAWIVSSGAAEPLDIVQEDLVRAKQPKKRSRKQMVRAKK